MSSTIPSSPSPWNSIKPAHTLLRSLPGRTISAIAIIQGAAWLIVDPDKADTCSQIVQLLGGS